MLNNSQYGTFNLNNFRHKDSRKYSIEDKCIELFESKLSCDVSTSPFAVWVG